MAVGDIYRCTFQGRIDGQLTVNTFHLRETIATDVGDVEAHIKAILNGEITPSTGPMKNSILAFASVHWKLTDWTVQKFKPLTFVPRLFPIPPVDGTHTGDALPSFCSAVISFRGPFAGRKNRGRAFIPGIAENVVNAGKLDAAALNELHNLGLAFASPKQDLRGSPGGGAGKWELIVYSKRSEQLGLINFTTVTTSIARDIIGTTRSRKIGMGV